jgi:16S rRNA G966 N2-methylase RsmD
MLENSHRLDVIIKPSLIEQCKDKVVIDLGCGTGILGVTALDHGAKFVYFIEQSQRMVEILKKTLHKIIDPSKFKIINKFAQDITVKDFNSGVPELCVSELYGNQLFDEGFYHCTKPLKTMFKDLIFIPDVFQLNIYKAKVDYNEWPWPKVDKRLLGHFQELYSVNGWNQFNLGKDKHVSLTGAEKIGEIVYSANTGVFKNYATAIITPTEGLMINLDGRTSSGIYKDTGPTFGWYVPPSNEKLIVKLEIFDKHQRSNVNFTLRPYSEWFK